jgi:hypothetical protein
VDGGGGRPGAFRDDCRSEAAPAGAAESRSSKTAAGASGELSGGVLPRASGGHGEESGPRTLWEARAAAASSAAEGGVATEVADATMRKRGRSSRSGRAAAPADRVPTCREEGWEEGVEGGPDLVAEA